VMVMGWWFDPGVFAKNGWAPPKTWDELLALCEKIKARGIAPITYQGQYPYYMIEGMLMPWAYAHGGMAALNDLQNLEPGAWKSASVLDAATKIDELNRRGYFQKGATGMSHTESQTQFLNGKAAMIPCGSWLFSEMKEVMPAGATVEYFLPPVPGGGKGDPSMVIIGIEPWMVPTDAKNPDAAIALFKYMTSLDKAKEFVEQKGTLMAIRGSEEAKMPAVLKGPAGAVKSAKEVWANQYRQWYPGFEKEIEGALTSMLNRELSPQQFVDRCEAAAEKTRKDASIPKYRAE
jgi:N-acetylglucosamine transport system substrate-binding protein